MAIKKKWKFESGGNSNQEIIDKNNGQEAIDDINFKLPIGISLPIISSDADSLFNMNYELSDEINDQLKNLIYTEPGERLCDPKFGTNLKGIISRNHNLNDIINNITDEIRAAITRYIPIVNLKEVTAQYDKFEQEKNGVPVVVVNLTYFFIEPVTNIESKTTLFDLIRIANKVYQRKETKLNIKIGLPN